MATSYEGNFLLRETRGASETELCARWSIWIVCMRPLFNAQHSIKKRRNTNEKKRKQGQLGVLGHSCNSSTQEVDAGLPG